jgi:hypothetical protein
VIAASSQKAGETLLIRGTEIPVRTQMLDQSKLQFFPDNPRVYSVLRADGKAPTQEEIRDRLLEMEHVKHLIQDIKSNGGLIEPLIVRESSLEVLEGNSRLAAYRYLAKLDAIKWGMVKCTILPSDVSESLVFALLGEYHIKGKKDWAPFEQAGFLYRRYKQHNADIKALALEINISAKKIKHLIDTYEFMMSHGEADINTWSYYDEYLKSNKVNRVRRDSPELDQIIVQKIRSGEIERAMDLRDQLPVICTAPGAAFQKLVSGDWTFDKAYRHACRCGGDSVPLKKLMAFRKWVTRKSTRETMTEADGQMRAKLRFEMGKIAKRATALAKHLSR